MAEQTYELYIGSATGTQIDNAVAKVAEMEETLTGTAGTIPSSKAVKDAIDAATLETDSTLSESTSKVPTSKAVSDAIANITPEKTMRYYTLLTRYNTEVIDGYSYSGSGNTLTAESGKKCFLVNIEDNDMLTLFSYTLAVVCDGVSGTSIINNAGVFSKGGVGRQLQNFTLTAAMKGKKLLIYTPNLANAIYASIDNSNTGGVYLSKSVSKDEYAVLAAQHVADMTVLHNLVLMNTAAKTDILEAVNPSYPLIAAADDKKGLNASPISGQINISPTNWGNEMRIAHTPNLSELNIDLTSDSTVANLYVKNLVSLDNLYIKALPSQFILIDQIAVTKVILEGGSLLASFAYCNRIERLDLTKIASFRNVGAFLCVCPLIKWVDITNVEVSSNSTYTSSMLMNDSNLETLIGDHTLSEVEAGTVRAFVNCKHNLRLSYCSKLSRASLLATIKGVYDFSQDANFNAENTYATLTLGETLIEKLEENDIDILIAKGWDFV